ncbi:hypothetical protein PsAD2_04619 [Pseudovibrio axinellae]|uniref:DUF6950 domain-containing protein n=1 Tax=Pseudovibrio axinellae TaxID=989403 RepID=A0A165SVQ4_9HYPH|nr:hypothetical protein [Pseudovibrio axinellae]KZL04536.1 hypothetical protein PsAD2_04619 [Pseudovibrio axinellae]SEQ73975.1 hypothetical protein SAMN05421798_10489 [Pseudovibrio axinellae]
MKLEDFTALRGREPFLLGSADCCLVLADWAVACGHPDGAAHLRGTYQTNAEFIAIAEKRGGLVELVGECAGLAGIPETSKRVCGVIGVVGSTHNPLRQWGAIWNGGAWLVRMREGFIPTHAYCLKMWGPVNG